MNSQTHWSTLNSRTTILEIYNQWFCHYVSYLFFLVVVLFLEVYAGTLFNQIKFINLIHFTHSMWWRVLLMSEERHDFDSTCIIHHIGVCQVALLEEHVVLSGYKISWSNFKNGSRQLSNLVFHCYKP